MTALAVAVLAVLGGGTFAHAATTEARMVEDFWHFDPTDTTADPNTGWVATTSALGSAGIGSAYGAPEGHGREALMLDTRTDGDSVEVHARTDQPDTMGAFPGTLKVAPDQRLEFWLYRSSTSSSQAGPVLRAHVGNISMFNPAWISFDPVANSHTSLDTWTHVDATAADAVWTVTIYDVDNHRDVSTSMTWPEVIDRLSMDIFGVVSWASFQYGLSFEQKSAGTHSAIDGVRASTNEWSSVTEFEFRSTSGQPLLDSCKNDGWWQNYPNSPFKNQGACIASLVAAN